MVKTTDIGKPGDANKAIGGVPILYYFDFDSKGRAEAVRLFMEDSQIAFTDVRLSFDEFPKAMESELYKKNPLHKIPIIELGDKTLTQSYSILRYFSRLLKSYDGTDDYSRYFVDKVTDVVIDWRTQFVAAYFAEDKSTYANHAKNDNPLFMRALDAHYKIHGGPYCLGHTITYADFVCFQILHDEGYIRNKGMIQNGLDPYPALKKMAEAMTQRQNIKEYLHSDRYFD